MRPPVRTITSVFIYLINLLVDFVVCVPNSFYTKVAYLFYIYIILILSDPSSPFLNMNNNATMNLSFDHFFC